MEAKKRTKYYPISLKDKELHDRFMMLGIEIGSKNADQTIKYLLGLQGELKKCKDDMSKMEQVLAECVYEDEIDEGNQ